MFAPTTELLDADWNPVLVEHVAEGRKLTCRARGRFADTAVIRRVVFRSNDAAIVVTAGGRRLSAAADQPVLVQTHRHAASWKKLANVRVGDLLFVADDGVLAVDRVTCTVRAEKPMEQWFHIKTVEGTVFAGGVLCRAS